MKKLRFNGRVMSKYDMCRIIDNIAHSSVCYHLRRYSYDELRKLLLFVISNFSHLHNFYSKDRFSNLQ